jgi:hypothetical protein
LDERGVDPEALKDMPNLAPDLAKIIRAFFLLCRTRLQSMGKVPQRLQPTEIVIIWDFSGCKKMGMTKMEFLDYMLALDDEYVAFAAKRA